MQVVLISEVRGRGADGKAAVIKACCHFETELAWIPLMLGEEVTDNKPVGLLEIMCSDATGSTRQVFPTERKGFWLRVLDLIR